MLELNKRELEILKTIVLESNRFEKALFAKNGDITVYQKELLALTDKLIENTKNEN